MSGRTLPRPGCVSAQVANQRAEAAVNTPLACCAASREGAASRDADSPQFDAATVEAIVRASCEQQHVPTRLTDAFVVRRVATLLGSPETLIRARAGSAGPAAMSHLKMKGAADGSGSPLRQV